MKTIQPVTVWYNGQEQQATLLMASASSDNLINCAYFNYQLLKPYEYPQPIGMLTNTLVSGTLTMTGQAYNNWQTNEYAYNWVAEQLNLTIIGDYVPPAPTVPEPVLPQPETTTEG